MSTKSNLPGDNRRLLLKYAGLAMQLVASIGGSIWLGMFIDRKTGWSFPAFAFSLPVLVIIGLLVQVIKDTQRPGANQN